MNQLTGQQKIELALRAGNLAKVILELTSAQSAQLARMYFVAALKDFRELDEFITKAEK